MYRNGLCTSFSLPAAASVPMIASGEPSTNEPSDPEYSQIDVDAPSLQVLARLGGGGMVPDFPEGFPAALAQVGFLSRRPFSN
jgi:hypothetical protein